MNTVRKRVNIIAIAFVLCSVLSLPTSLGTVFAEKKGSELTKIEQLSSENDIGVDNLIEPTERGTCKDFTGKLYEKYCNRKRVPSRPLTEQEARCAAALGFAGLSMMGGPMSWPTAVGTFGPAILTCLFGW